MFQHVERYAGDPILTLNEAFGRDPRSHKINLTIGIYFDEHGRVPVMSAVREAEAALLQHIGARPYQPMEGAGNYRQAVQQLVYGQAHEAVKASRIATAQTLGGSGALKVGADFLKKAYPKAGVWISDPTWDNHRAIFEGAGFKVGTYPYHDAATNGLRFGAMLAAIAALPEHSIVVLHACCHNPTGVDLSAAEWAQLIPVIAERKLIPFIDMAYQGFGDGVVEDAVAVQALAEARDAEGAPLASLCANSFSKSFSLYGERCGALSVVCGDAAEAELVLGQLKAAVRRNYSSPPTHGGQIVAHVLQDPALADRWASELEEMRTRIQSMRIALHRLLTEGADDDAHGHDHLLTQRGMFSYTGLSVAQIDRLREDHGVYLLASGRMCVAGLNAGNVEAVATALRAVA